MATELGFDLFCLVVWGGYRFRAAEALAEILTKFDFELGIHALMAHIACDAIAMVICFIMFFIFLPSLLEPKLEQDTIPPASQPGLSPDV